MRGRFGGRKGLFRGLVCLEIEVEVSLEEFSRSSSVEGSRVLVIRSQENKL